MRLPAHAAHNPVRIKREIANGEDSFLFGLKIFRDRRTMRPRKRGVSNEIEIWFGAASDHGQASRNPVAAFCLDISQLYALLVSFVETVVSIRPTSIISELPDVDLDVVGCYLVSDGADLRELIDVSMLKQTAKSQVGRITWWSAPVGMDLSRPSIREGMVKRWIKGLLINLGARDFEDALEGLRLD